MRKIIKDGMQNIESCMGLHWDFQYTDLADNADKEIRIELNDMVISLPKNYKITHPLEVILYNQLPEILIFNKYHDKSKIFMRFVKTANFEASCYTVFEEKIRYFFVLRLQDAYALRDYMLSNIDEVTDGIFKNIDNIVICSMTKTGSLLGKEENIFKINEQQISFKLMEYFDLAKLILVDSEYNYLNARIGEINKKTYDMLTGIKEDEWTDLNWVAIDIIEKCLNFNADTNRLLIELGIDKLEFTRLLNRYKANIETLKLDFKYDWGRPFTTSEWIYQNALVIPKLDFTFIGVGYIKAVEQLIYSMIYEFFPKFSFVYNNKQYSLRTEEGKKKFMIGPFITYLENDKSEMLFNRDDAQLLVRLLKPWKQDVRNDHFHKDNIKKFESMNNIRYSTCAVIFTLISCIKPLKYYWESYDSDLEIDDENEASVDSNIIEKYDINDLPF